VTLAFIIVGGPDGSCSYEEPIHFFGLWVNSLQTTEKNFTYTRLDLFRVSESLLSWSNESWICLLDCISLMFCYCLPSLVVFIFSLYVYVLVTFNSSLSNPCRY
jgi:hypothetical protein